MKKQSVYKLILKGKEYRIPSKSPFLNDVEVDIYISLITEGQYDVKCNVSNKVFKEFVDHWISRKDIDINDDNISEYTQISDEFDRIRNLIQQFHDFQINENNISIKKEHDELNQALSQKKLKLDQRKKEYEQIINDFFYKKEVSTDEQFNDIKEKLFFACYKHDVKYVELLTKEKVNQENIDSSLNSEVSSNNNIYDMNTFTIFYKYNGFPISIDQNRFAKLKSKDVINSIAQSKMYEVKASVSIESLQIFLNYWIYDSLPQINIGNIWSYYLLSEEFGLMSDYLSLPEYEPILKLRFLIEKKGNENLMQKIERFIALHLDFYIEKYSDEMHQIELSSLFNIFYHSERKLNNHHAAYEFIINFSKYHKNSDEKESDSSNNNNKGFSNINDSKNKNNDDDNNNGNSNNNSNNNNNKNNNSNNNNNNNNSNNNSNDNNVNDNDNSVRDNINDYLILLGSLDFTKLESEINSNFVTEFTNNYIEIRKINEKDDFSKVIQLLEGSEGLNTYNFYATRYFIQSNFSKGFLCEVKYSNKSKILGVIYGTKTAKTKTIENEIDNIKEKVKDYSFYKFHIHMMYVKKELPNQRQMYQLLIEQLLKDIEEENIDNNDCKVSEVNATVQQIKYHVEYISEILTKNGFFKYDTLIRYYGNGESNVRMKKILYYPEAYNIKRKD